MGMTSRSGIIPSTGSSEELLSTPLDSSLAGETTVTRPEDAILKRPFAMPPSLESLQLAKPQPSIAPANLSSTIVDPIRTRTSVSRISDAQILKVLEKIPAVAKLVKSGSRPFPHPFPARMPLEVAKVIVGGLTAKGGTVLDPMLGSGTTVAAAQTSGRPSVGFDTDPLAVLLATARCRPGAPTPFENAVARVEEEAQQRALSLCLDDLQETLGGPEDVAFLDRWFPSETQVRLFALSKAILAEPDSGTRASLIALFSSMIITKQGGVTCALDVSRSRAHYCAQKKPADAFAQWRRRAAAFIRHADTSFSTLDATACLISRADARALPVPDETADLILTSPPYLDAIDYMRASRFSLVWIGHTLAGLRKIRGTSIGSERGLESGTLPDRIERILIDCPAPARRLPMLRRYLVDMLDTLRESRRCTKPGGVAVFVVGPSLLSRRRYDGGDVLAELARDVGWHLVGHSRRNIAPDGRSLPPPRRTQRSRALNNRMSCEFYVAFRNPG